MAPGLQGVAVVCPSGVEFPVPSKMTSGFEAEENEGQQQLYAS